MVKIGSVHYIGGFGKRIWGGKERGLKSKGWRPEGPRAGWSSWGGAASLPGEGQPAPPHQPEGRGSAVSSLSGVWGGAPAAIGFSRILNTQDDFSGQQDYGPRRFYFFGFVAEW